MAEQPARTTADAEAPVAMAEKPARSTADAEALALGMRCFYITDHNVTNGPVVDALFPPASALILQEDTDKRQLLADYIATVLQKTQIRPDYANLFATLPPWYSTAEVFTRCSDAERVRRLERPVPIPPVVMRTEGPVYVRILTGGPPGEVRLQRVFVISGDLFCAVHGKPTTAPHSATLCAQCKNAEPASEEEILAAFQNCPVCRQGPVACNHPVFPLRSTNYRHTLKPNQAYLVYVTRTPYARIVRYSISGGDYCIHAPRTRYPCNACKSVNHAIRDLTAAVRVKSAHPAQARAVAESTGHFEDDCGSEDCDSDLGLDDDDSGTSASEESDADNRDGNGDSSSDSDGGVWSMMDAVLPHPSKKRVRSVAPFKKRKRPRSSASGMTLGHGLRVLERARRSLADEHRLREGCAAMDNIDIAMMILEAHHVRREGE